MSLVYQGTCTWGLGDANAGRELMKSGLAEARACRSDEALARALLSLAWIETEFDLDRAAEFSKEAEEVSKRLNVTFDLGHVFEVRGFILVSKGELDAAAQSLTEALRAFPEIQYPCWAHVLETTAGWAALAGRLELGAELLGAATRIREETADKPRPWERVVQEEWLPRIVDGLDPPAFEAAMGRGRAIPSDQVLAFGERAISNNLSPSL